MLRETFRDDAPAQPQPADRQALLGRPAAHRRRRRRADHLVGARAALHGRQHALRGPPLADPDHEPDQAEQRRRPAHVPEDEWDARPDAELRAQIGDRTVSRLYEMCGDPLPMFGDDRRLEQHFELPTPARAGRRATPRTRSTTPAGRTTGRVTGSRGERRRLIPRHGRNRDRGRPVGRRGQGQGRRPPRREGGSRDPLPGRQQRRAHHRARRRALEVPPDPVGDPVPGQAVRDRQRRRDRPEGADGRAGRPARQGRRPLRPADQRQRAPDHAVPHVPRPRGRDEARQAADRHHAARHRPLLRRQGRAPGHPHPGPARREDPQEEDRRRDGPQAPVAAALRQGARARPAVDDRGLPDLRPPHRPVRRRHRPADLGRARPRRQRALRGRAGHAAGHRPRHLSVRDLVEPGLRLRLHRHRHRARRTSTRSGASPRPTPRASAPARSRPSSTTSSASRCARPAASTARPPAARAASAGSTSSPCATRRASTRSRTWRSRSSTS